jgi:hypothetical protein
MKSEEGTESRRHSNDSPPNPAIKGTEKYMKRVFWQLPPFIKIFGTIATVIALGSALAPAQLAITEVMSSAAVTQFRTNIVKQQSDWWELTNFGTNAMDLTGYYWIDNLDRQRQYNCFEGLVINPGESVVFWRLKETLTEDEFRAWWGDCLSASVRVVRYPETPLEKSPGFNETFEGDELRLFNAQGRLVDGVKYGQAQTGKTFVSDPETGDFGCYSLPGDYGVCKAALADDYGSPGRAYGPVRLRILEQPADHDVCGGAELALEIRAAGLPRPMFEWQFFNTQSADWEPIARATSSSLTIKDVQSVNEGQYRVVLTNGLERLVSAPFRLTVNTNLTPPSPQTEFSNVGNQCPMHRFEGETATFTNAVCAFPRAAFQWYANGELLSEATNRDLEISGVTTEISGTIYSVVSSNALGWIISSTQLFVHPLPTNQLEITEVMCAPAINPQFAWWELTNRGTNAVELHGFRHSDGNLWQEARIVTQEITLCSGESLIMVDSMTREQFFQWWGAANLPPNLQVITYGGYGLDSWSDQLTVWSAAGTSLSSISYASPAKRLVESPVCPAYCDPELEGHSLYGHSLFFDARDKCAFDGRASQQDLNGGFRSALSDDVGSPGFVRNPIFLSIERQGSQVQLHCRVIQGNTYELQGKHNLGDMNWERINTYTAQSSFLMIVDIQSIGAGRNFYLLQELP